MRKHVALSILVLAGVVAIGMPAPAAEAASCYKRTGVHHKSPYGATYNVDWICGNRSAVPVRFGPFAVSSTGWLDSTRSWFICWSRGQRHGGGNDVWYFTQGDRWANRLGSYRGWGYVPAQYVWTSIDPVPGMRRC